MKKVLKWFGISIAVLFVLGIITNRDKSATDKAANQASNTAPAATKQAAGQAKQTQAAANLPTVIAIQLA